MQISVVGLGKLGLPLLGAIASRGFSVIGYDQDKGKIRRIQAGVFPHEPRLPDLLSRYRSRITFTSSLKSVLNSTLTFIVVPTPSLANGSFSLRYVESAAKELGLLLRQKGPFQTIVVVSTVLPGNMGKIKRLLETFSGEKCGQRFGLCYNPTLVALGSVIQGLLAPDFVLIGESDPKSGANLQTFYRRFCVEQTTIHRMNFVNAELAKISVNAFVTMKISFANTLARLAGKFPQGNAKVVTEAIGTDKRIGLNYLKAGPAYGGPCFPRDNRAFSFAAKSAGVRSYLAEATDRTNAEQEKYLKKLLLSHASPKDRVAVLGLSYKTETDVIDNSPAVPLIKMLLAKKFRVTLYDPISRVNAQKLFQGRVSYSNSLSRCVRGADILVITTPWKEFNKISNSALGSGAKGRKIIIDCWGIFEGRRFPKNVTYVPLGVGSTT